MSEPTTGQETAGPVADEDTPRIGAWTYVLAVTWAGTLIAMAWVMPLFGAMFRDMGYGEFNPLPISVRALVDAPMAAWIAPGLLVGGGLILKSRLLPAKRAERIDNVALVLFFVFVLLIDFSLFRPLVHLTSRPTAWPSWLPF